MTLQLIDNTWELRIDTTFDASVPIHNLGTYTNPYIVVYINSDDVLEQWRQAGSIGQAVGFGNDYAYGEIKPITLDSYQLLQFPLLTGKSYDLYYFPLPRLVNAQVKVWEYKGAVVNSSDIKIVLDCIKEDVTAIKSYLSIDMPPKVNNDLFYLFN